MRFSCTVCSFFRIHRVGRGGAHGYRQSSGCGELANPRFPQGPAEVSGLCQFLLAVYLQFQPASHSFDCLNLHQNSEAAFAKLISCFVSVPILVAPDPSRQFVVEAPEVGVGAVLSQRSSADGKMHPCTYFSHRLSPAERNYDIGNRELLVVKLALEEWRHWLEGSGLPFIHWTDHKNLEYIVHQKIKL